MTTENKKSMTLILEIDGKEQRFVTPKKLSGKLFRISASISDDIETNNIELEDLDSLLQFVCDCFGNQFSIDELEEGLDPRDLMKTIYAMTFFIMGQVSVASEMLLSDVDLKQFEGDDSKKKLVNQ